MPLLNLAHYSLAILLTLFAHAPSSLAGESDEEAYRTKIESLQSTISSLQKELGKDKGARNQLHASLKRAEIEIGSLLSKINRTNRELTQQQSQLRQLTTDQNNLQAALKSQQQEVAQYINAAYRLGQQSQLKMALNQEQPERLGRIHRYYSYFVKARTEKIDAYLDTLVELESNKELVSKQNQQLRETQQKLQQSHSQLISQQRERQRTLSQLNTSIDNKDQQLKELLLNKQQLEQLLREVSIAITNLSAPGGGKPFSSQRGKLPLPTNGKIVKRFGQTKVAGKLKWEGLLIQAKSGSDVVAVHNGRVIFSDYLRGHGLLLIIDHGDGYMTLYAHNQSLLKDIGDWVNSGETVARVGNSGGQTEPALYFEVRHQGEPTDPLKWCRS